MKLFFLLPIIQSGVNFLYFQDDIDLTVEDRYHLNLSFPYLINDTKASAKFNKNNSSLIITLPVQTWGRDKSTPMCMQFHWIFFIFIFIIFPNFHFVHLPVQINWKPSTPFVDFFYPSSVYTCIYTHLRRFSNIPPGIICFPQNSIFPLEKYMTKDLHDQYLWKKNLCPSIFLSHHAAFVYINIYSSIYLQLKRNKMITFILTENFMKDSFISQKKK